MRLVSAMTWIGSGWPEWVSNEAFDKQINEIQSISSYAMVGFNTVPGLIVDAFRRFAKHDYIGSRNGLVCVFSISSLMLVIQRYFVEYLSFISPLDAFIIIFSVLASKQNEISAIISVILYTVGRAFGSLWVPLILHIFSVDTFGFMFGMTSLISLPFIFAVSPMTTYCTTMGDYSLVNYILAFICGTTLILPVAIFLTKKEQKTINDTGMDTQLLEK